MRTTRSLVLSFVLVALFGSSAWAQTRRVSGRVTVEGTGEPIPAATVQVVGTTFGAATDETGRFTVSAPDGPITLRVRRIGFAPKTLPVGSGLTDVNVSLAKDVLELDKQVITGTATTVSSINAANAVAVVSGERLNRVPAATIDNALQGKVSGAVITQNSGAPGGGVQVQLRGISTLNAGFQPLYVIDGVIVNNSGIQNGLNVITQASRSGGVANFSSSQDQTVNRIADINPNDIESIQVLKGPSASSIYGSKGTNGVILITTKQGRAGRSTFDVTQRVGKFTLANKIGPFFCFESAAGADASGHFGKGVDGQLFTAATTKCHDYEEELYGSNDDISYQTTANLRGTTGTGTNYFISGLAQHDNGLGLNDFYKKQSLRANLGQQFGSRLNVRANTELLHSLTQRGVFGNDNTGINPYTTFSATPSYIELRRNADGSFPRNPENSVGNNNPFQNADRIKTPENVYRMIGSLTGVYNLMSTQSQTLDATLTGGVDSYNDVAKVVSPADIYVEQVNANPGTVATTSAAVVQANLNGTLAHRMIRNVFTATTSVGFRQDRRQSDVVTNIGRGIFPGVTSVSAAVQTFSDEGQSLVKDFSIFAQEEFLTLSERLLLTAAINSERSSNNGDPDKYYAYPKFSVSYRVPEIIRGVNELKLRAAFGQAGNQPTQGKFTFLTTLFNEGRTGFRASTVKGSSNIKPETARELEGGLDLTAFDGRVRLSATQFRKAIDNLLLSASVAPSTGFSSAFINGGQIVNHGTELELGLTPIQSGSFEWVSNTTYASQRGKVTRLPVTPFIPTSGSFGSRFGNGFITVGQSPSVIQAVNDCRVGGVATGAPVVVAPRSSTAPFGGSCPSSSRVLQFVGDGQPDYTMGFSNDFTFGSVRLSSLLDWRKGSKGVNLTNNYFDGGFLGDSALGNARLTAFRSGKAVYVENTGFVKLRELSFSYQLPSGVTSRLFNGRAQQARLELSGRNLWTKTDY
ncbi:MAG: SusC/RagA family TonB-linked outer membrane protein, partial [Gemmatimonadaceae bacterium]|nr:SusC/RagA family TonB-linked outer membrane protein [Gemmatimonadaceae bacterium]